MYFDKCIPICEYGYYKDHLGTVDDIRRCGAWSDLCNFLLYLQMNGDITQESYNYYHDKLMVFHRYASGQFREDEIKEIESYGFKINEEGTEGVTSVQEESGRNSKEAV